MNEQVAGIASILDDMGVDAHNVSVLTIGLGKAGLPEIESVHAYDSLSGPEDLPETLRVQLGIVVAPLASMSRAASEQLLSRLRDVHCEKVLLLDMGAGWTPDDLRALGYLEVERQSLDGRCYLFDPDLFNQPREWNNPTDWANPENFRKYRW
ncbi:MAG TPA: DUF6231 family protein [Woeseiaceae bacterium]|nr:DUF6231 family protein [Woeseiaceae bacterium]